MKNRTLIVAGVIIALVMVIVIILILNNNSTVKENNIINNSGNSYTATKKYASPEGTEQIDVTVYLEGDTINNLVVKNTSSNKTSSRYQSNFSESINNLVVGKSIKNNFDLHAVSGSSATSAAFLEALKDIQSQVN